MLRYWVGFGCVKIISNHRKRVLSLVLLESWGGSYISRLRPACRSTWRWWRPGRSSVSSTLATGPSTHSGIGHAQSYIMSLTHSLILWFSLSHWFTNVFICTVYPRNFDSSYIVTYYVICVKTSWTNCITDWQC